MGTLTECGRPQDRINPEHCFCRMAWQRRHGAVIDKTQSIAIDSIETILTVMTA